MDFRKARLTVKDVLDNHLSTDPHQRAAELSAIAALVHVAVRENDAEQHRLAIGDGPCPLADGNRYCPVHAI